MKPWKSRGNLLSGRAPRQADFFPTQWLILHLTGVGQNNPALQAHTRSLCRVQTSSRGRCCICWGGDVPSAPTQPCWTITRGTRLCAPCVWCRFVISVLWGIQKCWRWVGITQPQPQDAAGIRKRNEQHMGAEEHQKRFAFSVHKSEAENAL